MKVLIIEDEKAMSDLIAIKFQVEGFEVEQALTVADAKNKLTAGSPFHAILSDYLLPDGNCLDLLVEIRNNPSLANIPVIIMTNYVEDMNTDKAKELGVAEILVKYQTVPAQMVEKVKNLIVATSQGGTGPTGGMSPPSGAPLGGAPSPTGAPPTGMPPAQA